MTKYLHTMIRVSDPDATIRFFELIGLKEVRRFDNEAGRFTLIFLAAPGQEGVAEIELAAAAISVTSPTGSGTSTRPASG
jgi:lactoylglutathione lyase